MAAEYGDAEVGKIADGQIEPSELFGSNQSETEADQQRAAELNAKYIARSGSTDSCYDDPDTV